MATKPPNDTIKSLQSIVDTMQQYMPVPPPPPLPKRIPPPPRAAGVLLSELIKHPLYTDIRLQNIHEVRGLRLFAGKFDMYCPACKKESTWECIPSGDAQSMSKLDDKVYAANTHAGQARPDKWLGYFQLWAKCARGGHLLNLNMLAGPCENSEEEYEVTKIGQFPSMTDIELGDLKEFDDSLPKAMRKEFVKAINCAAHGFSVAACVYYRRIFESILVEARDEHMRRLSLTAWPEFERGRTDERIRMLRGHLPDFVVDHPHLYGLLSKGVHELSEKDCADEMPTLRGAMELVLRDRSAKTKERKQRDDVAKLLAQATDRHSK